MSLLRPLSGILCAGIVMACTPHTLPELDESFPFSLQTQTASLAPQLSQHGDRTLMSWLERRPEGAKLRFSEFDGDRWQAPQDVIADPRMFINWADLPGVTPLDDGRLLAYWLRYNADGPYSYDVMLAGRADDGAWSDGFSPHDDGTPTEHGFVSLHSGNTAAGLMWLDGRNTPEGGMTLRAASIGSDLTTHDSSEVDALVCDCCQTDSAVSGEIPVAVYRNRTQDEVRDIYITRLIGGEWTEGQPVAEDGWVIEGCPVNGPKVAASGETVVVAWFTGAGGEPRVKFAISRNGGKTFADPTIVAQRGSIGQVGLAMIDDTSFAISWMASNRQGSHDINIQTYTIDGQAGPVQVAGKTQLMRTVPQLLRHRDQLLMAWTDSDGDETQIVAVRISIRGFFDAL